MNKPEVIILHHSGGIESDPTFDTSSQTLEQIDAWHKANPKINLGYPSKLGYFCGYHIVIEKSGAIRRARMNDEIGAHVVGINNKSLGICIVGNFDRLPVLPNSRPTKEQEISIATLLRQLRQLYPNVPIRPHRYYADRTCFGRNLPDDWGEKLIATQVSDNTTPIATLEVKKLDIMSQIIATLRLLIIRWQNKLGGNRYA